MKKFITAIALAILISTPAYAADTKVQPYTDMISIEESQSFNVNMELNEFTYNGESFSCETFICMNTKYVPLRPIAEFLGAEVVFDQNSRNINIMYGGDAAASVPDYKANMDNGTASVTDVSIYINGDRLYHGSNSYSNEAVGYCANTYIYFFDLNGRVYVPLKMLTESFGLLRKYNDAKVDIIRSSDSIKPVPYERFKYVDYSEDLENRGVIQDWLAEEALLRQWNHYSEPFDVDMKIKPVYYLNKPAIAVEVYMINMDSYLISSAYEICEVR